MTLAPATCSTAACRKPFKARVRNGLKESRKCPACRQARTLGKPLPRKRRIRVTRNRNTRLNVDWPATHAQRFADRRSFVALDGRWYCFGQDMTARRGECYRRDKGICQKCGAHVLWDFGEVDHILSKGQNPRDDRTANLQWICGRFSVNRCHLLEHGRVTRFGEGA